MAKEHALWSLHALKSLEAADVRQALLDQNPHLRELGLRLAPDVIGASPELATLVTALSKDPSPRVRWQLAFTLGELPAEFAVPGLKELARRAAEDSDLRTAWLSSSYSQLGTIATELLAGETEPIRPLIVELARLIGSGANPAESLQLLDSLVRETVPDATRIPVLLALDEGLRRRGSTILKVVSNGGANSSVHELLGEAVPPSHSALPWICRQKKAIGLPRSKCWHWPTAVWAQKSLPLLLSPQTPPSLQQAAVKSLTSHETIEAFGLVLEPWKGFGPATRREIVDSLVQSARGATTLIRAIESGAVKPGEIERDKRQLLLNHPQSSVSQAAKVVLAEPPSNRKQVVANFQPALELTGDAARGRMLYAKTCMQCHRAGTAGHQVGPDFVSVQNKSPGDLLVAILDPNREAQPSFQTYTSVTKQGKIYTGIISAETAASLTLKRAEAKEDVILRETIDELVSNGVSLMPEGLEKDLNQQQLADIIAAIKSLSP